MKALTEKEQIVSAISLALMVTVYRLTLSRTTFHGFNRFVLLAF